MIELNSRWRLKEFRLSIDGKRGVQKKNAQIFGLGVVGGSLRPFSESAEFSRDGRRREVSGGSLSAVAFGISYALYC